MSLLPVNIQDGLHPARSTNNPFLYLRFVARRYLVFGVAGFALFTLLLRMLYVHEEVAMPVESSHEENSSDPAVRWPGARLPPLYPQYHEYERRLPQHHWDAASHQGEPKFFFVSSHSRGSGWGNIMQEILLNAYLSYKANRAHVFYNYTWNDNADEDYSDYSGKPIPSRVPLTALIRGPIVGGAFPPGEHAPPAIAEQYFHAVCDGRKVPIDSKKTDKEIGTWMADPITKGYVAKLGGMDDQCVEVIGEPVYNWVTFGDRNAMEEVWADFAASPVITHFGWSPLVELAFDNNRELIAPTTVLEPPLTSLPYISNAERYTELKGLLVLHLRRGDYEGHCDHLAGWASSFLAFNALPGLEPFEPLSGGGEAGKNTPENHAAYRMRCFPTVGQIVARVREVQKAEGARGLEHVYVMTNGGVPWVAELKDALVAMGGFRSVTSSRDLVLNWEQKYVAQAVDMLVGQRAQVFIGNGWSSLTGGIVVMRQANGFSPSTTRFF